MQELKDKIPEKIGKETVYVDIEDDITSIINKVESAKEKIVALVLPKRASALQSTVNMRLLKRSAKTAGKEVVLVTTESALLPLAGVTGLLVTKSLDAKPFVPPSPIITDNSKSVSSETLDAQDTEPQNQEVKLDYLRSVGELASGGPESESQDEEAISLDDEKDDQGNETEASVSRATLLKDKKLKVPNFDKFRLIIILGIAGVIALIIFIVMAVKVLPKTTITINTESSKVSATFTLTTDVNAKASDLANNIIVPSLKTSDQTTTQQIPATGQQNNGLKSKGAITLSAQECGSIKPATDVPAGNGVASGGLVYITQANTHFSSSGQVNGNCITYQATTATDIVAQSGGTKYNGATSFSVAGRNDVTGTASTSTAGGTDVISTILSQSDIDNAKSKLSGSETDKFGKDFQKQLSDTGLYVIAQTYKLGEVQVSSSPAVGEAASTASLSFKITHSVLVLKTDDLKKVITAELNKQIDLKKQKLSDKDVLINLQVMVQSQGSPTNATLSVVAESTAVPVIDQNAVKKIVAGQKSGDIKSLISGWPGIKSVDVKLSPFWVSKSPSKSSKIHIILQEIKADNSPTNNNP